MVLAELLTCPASAPAAWQTELVRLHPRTHLMVLTSTPVHTPCFSPPPQVPLLLATDVASRGLDIPTVDAVINYDLPMLARDYVHRWACVLRLRRVGYGQGRVAGVWACVGRYNLPCCYGTMCTGAGCGLRP